MTIPVISIIIPAYNAAHLIGETLASIPPACSLPYEIIVSDDGSADNLQPLLNSDIHFIRNANAGPGAARNAGAGIARGEFLLFLDADDRLLPKAIDRLYAVLTAAPKAALAYGRYIGIDENGDVTSGARPLTQPSGQVARALFQSNFIVNPGVVLMRREAFESVGGFMPALRYSEDWELWVRLALHHDFAALHGAPVLEYRRHSQSKTAGTKRMAMEMTKAVEVTFANPDLQIRFSPKQLMKLRQQRLAHILVLQALKYWSGKHRKSRRIAAAKMLQAVKNAPRRAPVNLARFAFRALKR